MQELYKLYVFDVEHVMLHSSTSSKVTGLGHYKFVLVLTHVHASSYTPDAKIPSEEFGLYMYILQATFKDLTLTQ